MGWDRPAEILPFSNWNHSHIICRSGTIPVPPESFPDRKQTFAAGLVMENRFGGFFRLSVFDYLLSKGAEVLCRTWVLLGLPGRSCCEASVGQRIAWASRWDTVSDWETGPRQAVNSAVELWQLVLSIYFYVIKVGGVAPIEAWPRELVADPKYEEFWMVDYAFSILQRKVWEKIK